MYICMQPHNTVNICTTYVIRRDLKEGKIKSTRTYVEAMQRPSSTPSASSPRPRANTGFGIPRALPPRYLDPAALQIRPLLLPEEPNELPVMAAMVRELAVAVAAVEHAGFGAAAYHQRLLRLQQILERYEWQAWQSQVRRSQARLLFWDLRAIAEEERKGRQVMCVADEEFDRINAATLRYDN